MVSPSNSSPVKTQYKPKEVLTLIQKAIETGNYDFTSKNSIVIYNLSERTNKPDILEVKWHDNEA